MHRDRAATAALFLHFGWAGTVAAVGLSLRDAVLLACNLKMKSLPGQHLRHGLDLVGSGMTKRMTLIRGVREQSARYKKESGRASGKRNRRKPPAAASGYAYAAVFEPVEEGGYVVRFPAFGYLATQGETLAEARAMAVDCLEGRIACMLEAGEELPPSDFAGGKPRLEIVRIKPTMA